jgi:cytochrome c biogenesis protein CcmG, thiol:disulfide interchange protein DsbE
VVEPPGSARPVPRVLTAGVVILGVLIVATIAGLLLLPAAASRGQSATGPRPSSTSRAVVDGVASGTLDWGPAPAFDLPALDGRRLGPRDWHGRPLLLAFWASWCPPCREEAPVLVRLAARYAPAGLAVLAVDVRDNPAEARRFARAHGFRFPVVLDTGGQVALSYAVAGLPTMALIARDGRLVSLHPGPLVADAVAAFVAPVLGR